MQTRESNDGRNSVTGVVWGSTQTPLLWGFQKGEICKRDYLSNL